MDKNGTTQTLNPGQVIVSKHNDEIVKIITAPQVFCTTGIGVLNGAVVVAITWRIAPATAGPDDTDVERCAGPLDLVWPVKYLSGAPTTNRTGAITFPL